MPKPGIIDLPVKIFPKLKDTYTEEQLKHMLVITGVQADGSALQIFQTVPELLKNNQCISKAAVSSLLFPIVKEALEKENIESRPIWKPMHMQPVFEKYDFISIKPGKIGVGEDIFNRGLCLPSDIKNTSQDMEEIIHIVRKCFGSN